MDGSWVPLPGASDAVHLKRSRSWKGHGWRAEGRKSTVNVVNVVSGYVGVYTLNWSFLVGKPMVVGETHHFRKPPCSSSLGGGNLNISEFSPENWGRWTHFDSYFSNGLVQPPTRSVNKPGEHWFGDVFFEKNPDRPIYPFTKRCIMFYPLTWGDSRQFVSERCTRSVTVFHSLLDLRGVSVVLSRFVGVTSLLFPIEDGQLGGGFQYFFTSIGGRFPFWLIFCKGVETTN